MTKYNYLNEMNQILSIIYSNYSHSFSMSKSQTGGKELHVALDSGLELAKNTSYWVV